MFVFLNGCLHGHMKMNLFRDITYPAISYSGFSIEWLHKCFRYSCGGRFKRWMFKWYQIIPKTLNMSKDPFNSYLRADFVILTEGSPLWHLFRLVRMMQACRTVPRARAHLFSEQYPRTEKNLQKCSPLAGSVTNTRAILSVLYSTLTRSLRFWLWDFGLRWALLTL